MNKKEISEIKKQFKLSNKYLTIKKIGVFWISENNIEKYEIKNFTELEDIQNGIGLSNSWDELEEISLLDIMKKTLSGQIGKSLVEYKFPMPVFSNEKSNYKKLYNLIKNFEESNIVSYINIVKENINIIEDYAICICNCSYSIPKKDINGEKMDDEFYDGDTYDFIILSICPIENSKSELSYNKQKNKIVNTNINKVISSPKYGFIFPTFNERTMDVNYVLTYNKKPKEPNIGLIEKVLECNYTLTPEDEQIKFNNLITNLISKDAVNVDYELTKNIHQNISKLIENTSVNTEITELSKNDLKKILKNSGVSVDVLDNFDELYEKEIGKYNLKAVNLINSEKMDIKSSDITINVKNGSIDKISSKIIDGTKCLIVELDETIDINGLNVKIMN